MGKIQSKRLLALDAFRGLAIAGMILVNTPGSWSHVYSGLLHAKWHGCTFADLVFPFFLFAVGVAMYYSLRKKGLKPNRATLLKVGKRSVLLFAIGLLLRAFPFHQIDFGSFRIMGVLQRIALAYGLAALMILYIRSRSQLAIASTAILLGYWALLYFGGGEAPYRLESNLPRQIDLAVLGEQRLWDGFGIPFDPEGLLSTLPAVVSVLIGFLAGSSLPNTFGLATLRRYFLYGLGFLATGLLWGIVFPINKALWTSSYVLLTSGIALLVLTALLWLIDYKKYQSWPLPLVVFGMNPLFAYVLSIAWVKLLWAIKWESSAGETVNAYSWIYEKLMVPVAGHINGSLLFALLHILFFGLILYWLYRKRIFIRI